MASVFDQIGTDVARAELEAARALGVVMGFKHGSELPVPVRVSYVQQKGINGPIDEARLAETGEIMFVVPVQSPAWSGASGFSGSYAIYGSMTSSKPAAIRLGDRWEYPIGSTRYWFTTESRPIEEGKTYEVVAREERGLTFGQRS